jgi:hypothetical protein
MLGSAIPQPGLRALPRKYRHRYPAPLGLRILDNAGVSDNQRRKLKSRWWADARSLRSIGMDPQGAQHEHEHLISGLVFRMAGTELSDDGSGCEGP